jgi:hypothetical protein
MLAVLALGLALGGAAQAESRDVQDRVREIRRSWEEAEARIEAGQLRRSELSLATGQNPTVFELTYEGPPEAAFEDDPYATGFTLRRVVQRQVLAAVGPAQATFHYDQTGELIFVFTSGADIVGSGLPCSPTDELRVYYHQGEPFYALWDQAKAEPTRQTFFLEGELTPEARPVWNAAMALEARGEAVGRSLHTLVNP